MTRLKITGFTGAHKRAYHSIQKINRFPDPVTLFDAFIKN